MVLIGGGGHCKVVISILKEIGEFEIIGISDLPQELGKEILGIKIKFTDNDLKILRTKGVEFALVTVGSISSINKRIELFEMLKNIGFKFPVVISPKSIVAKDVEIGEGTVIMPGAIVNTGVKIGKNTIINTGTIIEHDCTISDHVHIATGAILCGGVYVGKCSHIGTGAVIRQGIKIGDEVTIGAGAVVVKNIPPRVIAKGIPAKW